MGVRSLFPGPLTRRLFIFERLFSISTIHTWRSPSRLIDFLPAKTSPFQEILDPPPLLFCTDAFLGKMSRSVPVSIFSPHSSDRLLLFQQVRDTLSVPP